MGWIQEGIAQQSGDTRIDFENLAREALQALPKKWWTEGWLSGSHHESSKSFHHRMAIHPRVPSKGFSKFKALSWPDFHCNRCNPHKTTIITDFLIFFWSHSVIPPLNSWFLDQTHIIWHPQLRHRLRRHGTFSAQLSAGWWCLGRRKFMGISVERGNYSSKWDIGTSWLADWTTEMDFLGQTLAVFYVISKTGGVDCQHAGEWIKRNGCQNCPKNVETDHIWATQSGDSCNIKLWTYFVLKKWEFNEEQQLSPSKLSSDGSGFNISLKRCGFCKNIWAQTVFASFNILAKILAFWMMPLSCVNTVRKR